MILGFMIILPIIVSSWLTMEMERWRDGDRLILALLRLEFPLSSPQMQRKNL
ncbi:MAG: hypothetical protein AAGM46_09475 [Cyanobacteria bacterium J06582_2]